MPTFSFGRAGMLCLALATATRADVFTATLDGVPYTVSTNGGQVSVKPASGPEQVLNPDTPDTPAFREAAGIALAVLAQNTAVAGAPLAQSAATALNEFAAGLQKSAPAALPAALGRAAGAAPGQVASLVTAGVAAVLPTGLPSGVGEICAAVAEGLHSAVSSSTGGFPVGPAYVTQITKAGITAAGNGTEIMKQIFAATASGAIRGALQGIAAAIVKGRRAAGDSPAQAEQAARDSVHGRIFEIASAVTRNVSLAAELVQPGFSVLIRDAIQRAILNGAIAGLQAFGIPFDDRFVKSLADSVANGGPDIQGAALALGPDGRGGQNINPNGPNSAVFFFSPVTPVDPAANVSPSGGGNP